jgi:integrase
MVRLPKYRRRPDRDSAFVEIKGERIPLPGKVDSPESLAAYNRLMLQHLSGKLDQRPVDKPAWRITVADLVSAFLDFAKVHYMKNGRPGGEYHNCRHTFRPLLALHGETPASEFGPFDLKAVRQAMIDAKLSRTTVNARTNRIQRMFRWGVEMEIVSPLVAQAVSAVVGLRKGKTVAAEPAPVTPVDPAAVERTIPFLTPVVTDMIRLQGLTGMRSENLCLLRPCDIDQTDAEAWIYWPPSHKTDYLDKTLAIGIGPHGQEILRPYLSRPADTFIFSPKESELQRVQAKRAAAKASRKTAHKARGNIRDHYTPRSYWRAIWYAIQRANKAENKKAAEEQRAPHLLPHWHPHQLRHNVATKVRAKYKMEAARVFLGHSDVKVTEIYAERDLELVRKIAREIG